jgi:hypothetical protein
VRAGRYERVCAWFVLLFHHAWNATSSGHRDSVLCRTGADQLGCPGHDIGSDYSCVPADTNGGAPITMRHGDSVEHRPGTIGASSIPDVGIDATEARDRERCGQPRERSA